MAISDRQPDCVRCAHYFITHDPGFPYGCRALDFKSRQKPGQEVFSASGEPCRFYREKQPASQDPRNPA